MNSKKEIRGIYNVTFNEKKATPLKTDIELIEEAIIAEVIYYVRGWHNIKRDKGFGAEHIKIHLEKGGGGEITIEELLNLGRSIRAYLMQFGEAFIDIEGQKSAKIFEWGNGEGVRFRVVVDNIKGEGLPKTPLSPFDSVIISFYSDRNLEERMVFKNPKVRDYYKDSQNKKQKISDVGIGNNGGTNTSFHANISSSRNFARLANKEQVAAGEAVLSLHTSRPAELGGDKQKLSSADAHSATTIRREDDHRHPTTPNDAIVSFCSDENPKKQMDSKTQQNIQKEFMSEKDSFHQRFNEIVDAWLKEFGLKDLNDDYIPKIPQKVKSYIGNKEMRITQGNLVKLIQKEREHFIPFIKPTIEEPNIVLDNGKGILFIKAIEDESKNIYFMSVSKNFNGEWIFSSHTRRELSNIKNEIANSKVILNAGFERGEVAGMSDIFKSGGEVSKPSDLQIKYTANQDFGTNPKNIITQKDSTKQIQVMQEAVKNASQNLRANRNAKNEDIER